MIAIFGFSSFLPRKSESCQLESSRTTGVVPSVLSRKVSGLTVIFPPKNELNPACRRPKSIALTVLDFPLLPVTAIIGAFVKCRKMLKSVSIAFASARYLFPSIFTPGFFITQSAEEKSCSRC